MTIVNAFEATPENLADVPELTTPAVEAAHRDPAAACLIDRIYPGEPLFLCFAFRDSKLLRPFDFFGRTKKLEQRTGRKYNRILMRDSLNSWYHRGVPGLGEDVDEVASALQSLIRAISPSRIFTIGQSMGGYAAILFGMLLGAERIAAFGPLSLLDPEWATRYGDRRFLPIMQELRDQPPKRAYNDLVRLGQSLDYRGSLHVIFGTRSPEDHGDAGNFDSVHALRLAQLPNTILHPYPGALHPVVQWLIDSRQIDDLLAELFATELPNIEKD